MRALEKNLNARKKLTQEPPVPTDVQLCKKSRLSSSGDQQEKSNLFCVLRGIAGRLTQRLKVGNSLIFRKDLFILVFATFAGSSGDGIHTEVDCQIVVSDFVFLENFVFSAQITRLLQ